MISRRAMMNDKIVSQSGDTLLLEECKGSYLNGLRVFGKSTQFTTTGAQLIDLSDQIGKTETKNGATYKINDDQSITVSGKPTEYTSFFIKVMTLKAGTYFLNNEASDKNIFIQLIGNGINEGVFTLDEDLLNVGIYVVFNVAENNTKTFNFIFTTMLNEGSIAKPWEPYTGGKPSPSPEYPQKIVSAGERGSITVEVTGRNLLKPNSYSTYYEFPLKANTVMTLMTNGKPSQGGNIKFIATDGSDVWFSIDKGQTRVCRSIGNKDVKGFYNLLDMSAGLEYMFAVGNIKTYTPYVDPQSLTLATPNGLPGIPVATGGNYVDETGQQWVCDEIDLERGKYIKRIGTETKNDGWNLIESSDIPKRYRQVVTASNEYKDGSSKSLCNIALYSNWGQPKENIFTFALSSTIVYISPPKGVQITADELNTMLNNLDFPVMIAAQLATPIERDLTPEEIAAYKTVHTYAGTTVIMNDEKVGMEVSYRKVRG